jgi:hypothetical protein
VWAALLAVDRDGGLDALRATPKPLALVPLAEEAPRPGPAKAKPAKKKAPPPKKQPAAKKRAARRA